MKITAFLVATLLAVGLYIAYDHYTNTKANDEAGQRQEETWRRDRHKREQESVADGDAVDVTARTLLGTYRSNEVAAETRYQGRVLRVDGSLEWIRTEAGRVIVALRGGDFADDVVICVCEGGDDRLAKLAKGQRVIVRGVGGGKYAGIPGLRNCLVDSYYEAR